MIPNRLRTVLLSVFLILIALPVLRAGEILTEHEERTRLQSMPTFTLPSAEMTAGEAIDWVLSRTEVSFTLFSTDPAWAQKIVRVGPFTPIEFFDYLSSTLEISVRWEQGMWVFSGKPPERVAKSYRLKSYSGSFSALTSGDLGRPNPSALESEIRSVLVDNSVVKSLWAAEPFVAYVPDGRALFVVALPKQHERLMSFLAEKDTPALRATLLVQGVFNPIYLYTGNPLRMRVEHSVAVPGSSEKRQLNEIVLMASSLKEGKIQIDGWIVASGSGTDTRRPFSLKVSEGESFMLQDQHGANYPAEISKVERCSAAD